MTRKEREARFQIVKAGGYQGISPMLVHCGLVELQMALDDRSTPGLVLEPNNHGSSHSLGSILLLVAAFEAWLNESIAMLFYADPSTRAELVRLPSTWQKYHAVPIRMNNAKVADNPDLQTLLDLRNEIAHYLPFYVGVGDDPVPESFKELQRRAVFITAGGEVDFDFSQKLSSYGLAYWAWETIETALKTFLQALGSHRVRVEWTAENFYAFNKISSPEHLPMFDKQTSQPRSRPLSEPKGKATASFLLRPRRIERRT